MITPEKARQDYETALSALQQSALTPGMSTAERMTIRDAIRELTAQYLGQLEIEIQALTNQYQSFIASMSAVVDTLQGGATPVSLLNKLAGLVNAGTALVGAATGPLSRGVSGRARATRRNLTPAGNSLRILCVHGVGNQENDPAFESIWRNAITQGLGEWSLARPFEIQFVAYDDLFAADPPSAWDVARALVKLGASGIVHGIGDLFGRRRGFGGLAESVRWTAGMVVQWAENDRLRAEARKRVLDHTARFDPHVILAHSLGTLLSYDGFARPEGRPLVAGRTFVSFGSQIGNPFVRSTLGGRIEPLNAARWYHLFNPHDDAFTARLRIVAPNFEQVDAQFDIDGILDHNAAEYLRHPNTVNTVWQALATSPTGRGLARDVSITAKVLARQSAKIRSTQREKPKRRALLVGINDYPDPADRLEGCVNDVFLMSSLLQESGFGADDIRVVLNERATAKGILERLEWLLEGTEDEQERVFYYSGHGAQIPGYGVGEKVDRKDECLVAHDFDWSRDHAVTDDQFFDLYSQLPYLRKEGKVWKGARFVAIFDCCHSGGMTRDGGARVRGLTPPDDIRHRELKWSKAHNMWVPRDFSDVKENVGERRKRPSIFGEEGDLNRIGRSADLRPDRQRFNKACKTFGHKGPYLPIILQACEEKQFSYEYRHGVQSYGAFTYSLGLMMREAMAKNRKVTWSQLVSTLGEKLETLHYDQKPCLVCPTALKNQPVPWGI